MGPAVIMAPEPELHAVLELVRSGRAETRPELIRRSGLGRTLVNQRIAQLQEAGLVAEGDLGPSTGGRAPRRLRFCSEAGRVLAAEIEARSMTVGITDLLGRVVAEHSMHWDVSTGPSETLRQLESLADELCSRADVSRDALWSVGVGLPAPVEFETGRPIAPPIMPGWDGYPVRDELAASFGAPVWVDNDVNLLALGEMHGGAAQGHQDLIYLKAGTGIGAGLVSGGRLHRGQQGCAGDVGHVAVTENPEVRCLCGRQGCLEAIAGGRALCASAARAAQDGQSEHLARILASGREIQVRDLVDGAAQGDLVCLAALTAAGRLIGDALASLVNFFNPSLVVFGGPLAEAGDVLLAVIKQRVFERSLPLATRDLVVTRSQFGAAGGMRGAAFMVIEQLFRPEFLPLWIVAGSPRHASRLPVSGLLASRTVS